MRVSTVIPCYYSEATIAKVVTMTKAEFDARGIEHEFILVNDGSTDGTFQEIEKLCQADDHIVGIDLAKNVGQHAAIIAGLRQVSGDVVMVMDDDMQTHPSQCMALLDSLDQATDVVFAIRSRRRPHGVDWGLLSRSGPCVCSPSAQRASSRAASSS